MENKLYQRYEKLRDVKGYTDYKVAKLAGIKGTATISNWKNGKYTPKDDKMQAIATVLDVTFDYLKGNTDLVICPICGFGDNPLSEQSRKEHKEFHAKILKIKEKYPFFMHYADASKARSDSISNFRNPENLITNKMDAFEDYLKASFSLEISNCNYEIERLNYEEFCKVEVGTLEPDWAISQELIETLIEKYGVDKEYLLGNAQLLARVSKNDSIMQIMHYVEQLTDQQLETLKIQIKALAEQHKRG